MKAPLFRMATRNLRRNFRRSLATAIAIACGFASLLLFGGYVYRAENLLRVVTIFGSRMGHAVIYQKDGLLMRGADPRTYSLGKDEQERISAAAMGIGNVDDIGIHLAGVGLIGNGCRAVPFSAVGIEPALDAKIRSNPDLRRWAPNAARLRKGLELTSLGAGEGPLILADGLAKALGKEKVLSEIPGRDISLVDCDAPDWKEQVARDANVQLLANTWEGQMSLLDGEIVAMTGTGRTELEGNFMVAPLSLMQKLYDTESASFMTLWLKDPSRLRRDLAALKASLRKAGLEVDVYPWHDQAVNQYYNGTVRFLYTLAMFIAIVLGLVIALSIFNAATITVIERRQEIGMFRSLGFPPALLMRVFMVETIVLTALSVAAGSLVAVAAMWAVNAADIQYQPPAVAGSLQLLLVPNWLITVCSGLIVLVISCLATWVAVGKTVVMPIVRLLDAGQR